MRKIVVSLVLVFVAVVMLALSVSSAEAAILQIGPVTFTQQAENQYRHVWVDIRVTHQSCDATVNTDVHYLVNRDSQSLPFLNQAQEVDIAVNGNLPGCTNGPTSIWRTDLHLYVGKFRPGNYSLDVNGVIYPFTVN